MAGAISTARAACLFKAGDLPEAQTLDFMALAIRETGKSLPNALAKYGKLSISYVTTPHKLRTKRKPKHSAVVCISPWNFPLPDLHRRSQRSSSSRGTWCWRNRLNKLPLIAHRAIQLMHEAVCRLVLYNSCRARVKWLAQLVADSREKA